MDSYEPDNDEDEEPVEIDNLEIDNLVYKWKPTSDL